MRKLIISSLILFLMFSSTALAIDPYSIDREFLNNSGTYWFHEETQDSYYTHITETASFDGHLARFGIDSLNGSVKRVYFVGWLADMDFSQSEDLEFSESLYAYDDCLDTLYNYLPDDSEFDEIFSSYGIYQDLTEGVLGPYHEAGVNWTTNPSNIGRIEANHAGPYKAVAERSYDGWLQFQVYFP